MTDITPTAFITGGSKGIGYGIAQVLIKQGIRLAVTSRSQANADAAAAALNEIKSGFALGLEADVRSLVSQQQAIDKLLQRWQRLDYVIANAGVGHFAPIQEMTPQQWQETIDINLTGVFNTIKASLGALKASQECHQVVLELFTIHFE